jgi:tRNA(His) 5'-end guanylyltransferase
VYIEEEGYLYSNHGTTINSNKETYKKSVFETRRGEIKEFKDKSREAIKRQKDRVNILTQMS